MRARRTSTASSSRRRESASRRIASSNAAAVVADAHVAELHGIDATRTVPRGEAAKTLAEAERLWRALTVDRGATLVAVGGGSTTDLVGFVAATYMRGIDWIAVPSTLVGQVDAAIGGKVGIDLPEGKNLVGAFHWPARTVIDTTLLETLPEEERRNGLAEVVKTGLCSASRSGSSTRTRRCAVRRVQGGVCLRDPYERGDRAQLNLGHTFAHALEAASGYALPHGRAVALGLLAACRLSGLDDEARVVERVLAPAPVAVDRDAAWAALQRDKKARRRRDPSRPARDARATARHVRDRARPRPRGSRRTHRVGSRPCGSPC